MKEDYKIGDFITHKGINMKVLSTRFWRHNIVKGTLYVVSNGKEIFDFNINTMSRQNYNQPISYE